MGDIFEVRAHSERYINIPAENFAALFMKTSWAVAVACQLAVFATYAVRGEQFTRNLIREKGRGERLDGNGGHLRTIGASDPEDENREHYRQWPTEGMHRART